MKTKTMWFCLTFFFVLIAFVSTFYPGRSWAEDNNFIERPKSLDDSDLSQFEEEVEPSASPPNDIAPYVPVPAASFSVDGTFNYAYYYEGFYGGQDESYLGCIKTGVDIPKGATSTFFCMTYMDNSFDYDMTVSLNRVDANGVYTTIQTLATTGQQNSNVQSDCSYGYSEYVWSGYAYSIETCLRGPSLRLYQVRVYYSLQDETWFHKVIIN